ncbi:MAG: sigma-70 family RNA polymerase sigma factor [Candidatus Eisenbacteria bacterium]
MRQVQVVGYRTVHVAQTVAPVMERRDLSDSEAIHAIRAGDREAYKAIVERYMRRAYGIAITFVRNQQDAMDVSQMAFIKAYRNLRRFDTERPFFPWFYRILRNICLDHLKRASRTREIPLEDAGVLKTEAQNHEMKQMLWQAIEDLPLEQREAIVLRYFEGMSYREVAETLEMPIGTVMSSLHYAKRKMKKAISGFLDGEEK